MDNVRRAVIGLMAHVDAGKTTLSEALLYSTGKLKTLGRVDKKDAFLDNFILERERGITIFSKQAEFEYGSTSFTLLDTPGHVDFSTEMERTLSVLDAAVLVISGPEGIQAHTRTLWRLLKIYDIPTFIFVNKMDRLSEKTDAKYDTGEIIAQINKELSDACVCFNNCKDELFEQIAMCDENAMEEYLATNSVDDETVRRLVDERKLFPCYFGSALRIQGVEELLKGLDRFLPDPLWMTESATPDENTVVNEFSARVYKISHDNEGNRLSYIKVLSGKLHNRDLISYRPPAGDSDEESEILEEKVTRIRIYDGEKYSETECACAGMVVAVIGLSETYAGMGLGTAGEEQSVCPSLVPVMNYRVIAADKSRLGQLAPILKTLEEEDPSLGVFWNSEVKELQVRIMGEIQLDILKRQLLDRFGEVVEFDHGSILYKETVLKPTLGVGHFEPLRHYSEVQLMIEPGEPGSGITADSDVSVDELELNWQRLIMTHIFEREHKGVLTGSALTDVHIRLVAGKSHIKHTEGGDFRQSTYRAIRQGLMRAREEGSCVLLEPWYELNMELPRSCCGRAMTDIEKRFGRITGQEELGSGDMILLNALAPAASMQGYSAEVTAYTKGMGSLYFSFFGYLPCHNSAEVVGLKNYDPEADLRNPSSSVFCAHGAGFVVEWRDVDSYKHIDWDPGTGSRVSDDCFNQSGAVNFVSHATEGAWVGTEEIDAILERMAYSNRKTAASKNLYRKLRRESAERRRTGEGGTAFGTIRSSQPGESRKYSGFKANYIDKDRYLLVDGYNIINAWPELNELSKVTFDGARERLNEILCNYRSVHNTEVIAVYDAYRVAGHPTEFFDYNNIHIVFTKEAETADKYIERFAHENASRYDVTVATSDGLEQIIIRGAGCRLMTAKDLLEDVRRTEGELNDAIVKVNSGNIGTPVVISNGGDGHEGNTR